MRSSAWSRPFRAKCQRTKGPTGESSEARQPRAAAPTPIRHGHRAGPSQLQGPLGASKSGGAQVHCVWRGSAGPLGRRSPRRGIDPPPSREGSRLRAPAMQGFASAADPTAQELRSESKPVSHLRPG